MVHRRLCLPRPGTAGLTLLQQSLDADAYGTRHSACNRLFAAGRQVPVCQMLVEMGYMRECELGLTPGTAPCFSATDTGILAMQRYSAAPPQPYNPTPQGARAAAVASRALLTADPEASEHHRTRARALAWDAGLAAWNTEAASPSELAGEPDLLTVYNEARRYRTYQYSHPAVAWRGNWICYGSDLLARLAVFDGRSLGFVPGLERAAGTVPDQACMFPTEAQASLVAATVVASNRVLMLREATDRGLAPDRLSANGTTTA